MKLFLNGLKISVGMSILWGMFSFVVLYLQYKDIVRSITPAFGAAVKLFPIFFIASLGLSVFTNNSKKRSQSEIVGVKKSFWTSSRIGFVLGLLLGIGAIASSVFYCSEGRECGPGWIFPTAILPIVLPFLGAILGAIIGHSIDRKNQK
ncbi:MAG: hypothetical protein HYT43_00210 [Candidatus Taylorbacteria bacterium]|nr:hypothetical protein [Candidatus Taylorbacteria bacterium]